MQRLTSIVALNEQGVIGRKNALPWTIRSDLRFFKKTTLNNVVIMGRRTHDSIGQCLPKRINIILSHNPLSPDMTPQCVLARSISEALFAASYYTSKKTARKAFVIGGAQTYLEFSPFVDRYLITVVRKEIPDADAYFDKSISSSIEDWDRKLIEHVDEAQPGDDASYSIWEFSHPNPREVELRRNALVKEFADRNHFWKDIGHVDKDVRNRSTRPSDRIEATMM